MFGKIVEVKLDPKTKTYYYNPPKLPNLKRERKWLYTDKGKSATEFLDAVEQHHLKQFQKLPKEKIKISKSLSLSQNPNQTLAQFEAKVKEFVEKASKQENETLEEWKQRVFNNPVLNNSKYMPDTHYSIITEELANIFSEWLEDPYQCSITLKDERLAKLDKLTAKVQISISKLAPYYFNYIPTDRDQATEKERKKVKKWFEQFIRITGKTYLNDLSKADIENYTQTILRLAKNEKRSTTWIAHRYGAIRTVINTFARSLEDKTLPHKIIEWLNDYPAPQKKSNVNGKKFNPNPISKEQWEELLSVAVSGKETATTLKWKAILLFALNTCAYGVDCRDVKMENIDLKTKTLTMFRKKRGVVPKCGVLWDETVKAIKNFRAKSKKNSAYVFPTRYGTQYSEGGFYDYWNKYIAPKVSWKFDFNQLRDAGRYGAELGSASPNHITIAMGHRLKGVDDNYLLRHPAMVKDVAEAIYSHYMK